MQGMLDGSRTPASEKLDALSDPDDLIVVPWETLRRWLQAQGLWMASRKREVHRRRRERRACFGEMLQADASEHAWLEGRGPVLTLVGLIDDATDRVLLRFYPSETTFAYMDLLWRWLKCYGVPRSWYSDRHSVFWAEAKMPGYDEPQREATQFSRAAEELGIELISACSAQAKGRVERLWGTAQDRLVKELRLAGAKTLEEANAVLEKFMAWFNAHCTHDAASPNDSHRALEGKLDLAAILSHQEQRSVRNDYTICHRNRVYQLLPPAWPGLCENKVIVEERLDGTMHIRFKLRYLGVQAPPITGGRRHKWSSRQLVASTAQPSVPEVGARPTGHFYWAATRRPAPLCVGRCARNMERCDM